MLSFIKKLHISTKYLLAVLVLSASVFIFNAIAAPPTSPYTPGETLAPTCSPGDSNCTITTPAVSGANSDITSLTGLTTALSVVQGGTATTSIGSDGSLVYSNGTYYDFTATGTAGYVLQANGASVPAWVATSSLGLSGGSSLWTQSSNDIYYTTGKVGVGAAAPSSTFHVVSTTEQLRLGYDVGNFTSFIVGSDGALTVSSTNSSDMTVNDSLAVGGLLSATVGLVINTDDFYVDTGSGNVGIGTASPAATLHAVRGDGDPQLRLEYDGSNFTDFFALDGSFVVSSTATTTFNNPLKVSDSIVLNNANSGNDSNTKLLIIGDGTQNSTTFNDISASNHTVTAAGDTKHIRTTRLSNDSSILFDEVDDYLTVTHSSAFDMSTGDFTLEAWVYFDDKPDADEIYRIMSQGRVDTNNGDWVFGFGSTAAWDGAGLKMNMAIRSGGSVTNINSDAIDPINWAPYTWHHFAVSRSGTDMRFFVNGAEIYSETNSLSLTSAASSDVYVGVHRSTSFIEEFSGVMDEIRISNVARYTSDFVPARRHSDQDMKFKDGSGNTHTLDSKVSF